MTHASLFTGIGGFDLAAEWMGWNNVFQVEIDNWCQRLLAQNFPHAERYTDIKQFDGSPYRGAVDVLSGGFPCQPYSTAGKRRGKDDERHLWPEMLRVIREVSPRWIVGENVRGLTNWNGGVVFDEVQADLEAEGYEVLPFLLPACAVNAPHRRDRIWIIAHSKAQRERSGANEPAENDRRWVQLERAEPRSDSNDNGNCGPTTDPEVFPQRKQTDETNAFANGGETRVEPCSTGGGRILTNADREPGGQGWAEPTGQQGESRVTDGGDENDVNTGSAGWEERDTTGQPGEPRFNSRRAPINWTQWPTQSPVRGRDDGIPHRMDRLKGLGNAVVPQVVYQIFKAIEHYDQVSYKI
jgi:DNA (cytosine-5)-methyltransferase 1